MFCRRSLSENRETLFRNLLRAGPSGADCLKTLFQPVAEHRHAEKIFRSAAVSTFARRRNRLGPLGGVIVAAPDPDQRDEFGCLVDIEVVDQFAKLFLRKVFRLFFGQPVVMMKVPRVSVELFPIS